MKNGVGGSRPLTPAQNNTQLTQLNQIQTAIQTWQKQGIKTGIKQVINGKTYRPGDVIEPHPTDAQMRQVLGGSGKYNPVLIQAAFELLGWGHITPQTAAAMHNSGIRGGTYKNAPIQVAPPPQPPGPLPNTPAGNTVSNIPGVGGVL